MSYNSYTEEDFIMDEYFQKWIIASDPEIDEFWTRWIEENPEKKNLTENASRFIRMMNQGGDNQLSENEVDIMWQNITQKKERFEAKCAGSRKFKYFKNKGKVWLVAACFGLIVSGLGFNLIWDYNTSETENRRSENEIILKLGDGTVQVLDENATEVIMNAEGNRIVSQEKNILVYGSKEEKEIEITHNELIVPYGKKFELKLSDGSHVILNSGSKLRYPTSFRKGIQRTVFLDGEAYFSVTGDKESSFLVRTELMNTKVYGTEFNVSSYKNENNTSTVLIKGSVGVYSAGESEPEKLNYIIPGERASIQSGEIAVDQVKVKKHVAWTEGKLFFLDDRFELILKELERHFDVVIDNKLDELNNKRFTGTFKEETLDQIFRIFQEHTPLHYKIDKNTITIYRKI